MLQEQAAIDNLLVEKKWSVMIYLAGGRDISDEARESLLRMKQVGSTKNIHVIAQFDMGTEGNLTKRYYLSRLNEAAQIGVLAQAACDELADVEEQYLESTENYYCQRLLLALQAAGLPTEQLGSLQACKLIKQAANDPDRFMNFVLDYILENDAYPFLSGNLGDTNAGDPKNLVNFIQWAKVRYPAKHYLVIIWGHGNGLSVAWDWPTSEYSLPADFLSARKLAEVFDRDRLDSKFSGQIRKFLDETEDKIDDLIPGKDSKEANAAGKLSYVTTGEPTTSLTLTSLDLIPALWEPSKSTTS